MLTAEVIENIKKAVEEGDFNRKVMTHDHIVTPMERERYILPYDNTKRKVHNKLKRTVATGIVNSLTRKINKTTTIVGLENLTNYTGEAAIITANHFSPVDSTVVRYLTNKIGKRRHLSIVVAETNVFMRGNLGWLLKNVNTMPFTNDLTYLEQNFNPALANRFKRKHVVLFYPEQEMWPGYTRPRPLKGGAYHYASKFLVPIIPTFITNKKENGVIQYTIHVFPLLYPNKDMTLKENKEWMMKQDFEYKKNCYETFYQKKLTEPFSESDLIF